MALGNVSSPLENASAARSAANVTTLMTNEVRHGSREATVYTATRTSRCTTIGECSTASTIKAAKMIPIVTSGYRRRTSSDASGTTTAMKHGVGIAMSRGISLVVLSRIAAP